MTNCFLSCDWGTSQFRLRLVDSLTGEVLGEVRTSDGVGRLSSNSTAETRPELFRSTLVTNISRLGRKLTGLRTECPVVISGMASSTIGWLELPYANLPFRLDGSDVIWKQLDLLRTSQGSHPVFLVSGLRGADEIMRGEEIQVLGLTQLSAGRVLEKEAILILPGTHSKHVHVKAGRLVDFETYITGELFDVLSEHSVLKHSLPSRDYSEPSQFTEPMRHAFQEGVEAARSAPLLQQLFRIRTRRVLHGCDPEDNRAFLSGLLIGAELVGLISRCNRGVPVILCGGEALSEFYELGWQSLEPRDRLRVLPTPEVERLSVLGQAVLLKRILATKS